MSASIRLHPDSVRVESFAAGSGEPRIRGTARAGLTLTYEGSESCLPNETCPDCTTQQVG